MLWRCLYFFNKEEKKLFFKQGGNKMAEIKGHPHAELIAEYANISKYSAEPWTCFEVYDPIKCEWKTAESNISFNSDIQYRFKPKTIRIGTIDVPEPIRYEPDIDKIFYIANITSGDFYGEFIWKGEWPDREVLKRGVVHLKKENAILHAKAIISLTDGSNQKDD